MAESTPQRISEQPRVGRLDGPASKQGQAADEITVVTALPKGWASFCSTPDSKNNSHWYATAPWDTHALHQAHGEAAREVLQTVDAETWVQLHEAVREQAELYATLRGIEAAA